MMESAVSPSGLHLASSRYTGKERDAESGNDYFGARYYASTMGRFMSPDYDEDEDDPEPVPYAALENPQTLNLYTYGRNNPLGGVDVDGHDGDGPGVAAAVETGLEGGRWPRSHRSYPTSLRVPPVPRLWGPGREAKRSLFLLS